MQLLSAFSRPQTVPAVPVFAGASALERTRHLHFRGCVRRNGPPSAGNDPRVRRPRVVQTFSVALYLRADSFALGLRRFLLVGPQGHNPNRFLLGCLAWDDADLRFLSNLRRENRLLRCADAPTRLCDLCHLVRGSRAPFATTHGRHAGNVLRQRRTPHPAVATAQCAASRLSYCHHRHSLVPLQFFPDVGGRETSQSGEAGAVGHDHRFLVVLQ